MINPGHPGYSFTVSRYFFVAFLALGLITACGGSSSSKPRMSVNSPSVIEGDDPVTPTEVIFTVTLSKKASKTLTVEVATVDGTATGSGAEPDYTPVSETLTIAKGSRSASVSVYVNGDTEIESHETFTLSVSNPQGLKLDSSTQSLTATATITNDEEVNPQGYFNGTATLNGTEYNDMTALIYDNRVLMFSPTANVLYDIDLNSPDSLDYEGTVDLYVDGLLVQADSITVDGETTDTELSGSFGGGTGFGVGEFEVAFDEDNNAGASLERIEAEGLDQWIGNFFGVDVDTGRFASYPDGHYAGNDNTENFCAFPNMTTAYFNIVDANIYQMNHSIEAQGFGTCETTYASTGHTGFAAVIDDGDAGNTRDDDKLLFAFNNGEIALFGIMLRP